MKYFFTLVISLFALLFFTNGAVYASAIVFSTTSAGKSIDSSLSWSDDDLVKYDLNTGVFSLFLDASTLWSSNEDINAVDVLSNGNIILSTTTSASIGSVSFDDDDIVEYNPGTGDATKIFDGGARFAPGSNEDIDAVDVLSNGNIVLSTTTSATLGGLSFRDNQLVEYNAMNNTATMLFDGDTLLWDNPGTDDDINAVDILSNGNFILSTTHKTGIGGPSFNDDDLFEYNPFTNTATLIFDGTSLLFNTTSDEDIDGVYYVQEPVPEPSTMLLLCVGFAGLIAFRFRKKIVLQRTNL